MRILHLEDDPEDVRLTQELLRAEWPDCQITAVGTAPEFHAALAAGEYDVILSDFTLRSCSGHEALQIARKISPLTPFIFLSGTLGEDRALDAVRNGAADYVLKDNPQRLTRAIHRALAERRERQAREEAEQAQQRLVSIFENTLDLVAISLPDGTLTYVNRTGRRIAGLGEHESLAPHRVINFYSPATARLLVDHYIPHAIREGAWSGETELFARDGRVIPVSQVIVAHKDAQGRVSHLSTIARDISEAKAAEARLKKSEADLLESIERFELVSRATNDVVWDWNLLNDLIWWSESYEIFFGRLRLALSPLIDSWTDFLHPEDKARVLKSIHDAIDLGRETWTDEYRFRHADGHYVTVLDRGFILRNAEGKPYRMLGSMQDVTARRESEARVVEQASLLDEARDAIIVTDPQNKITFWNRGAERLFGWSAPEATGKIPEELLGVVPSPQLNALRRQAEATGGWQAELRGFNRAGQPITLETHSTLILDEHGKPKARFHILTDVTEKKSLEAKLLRSQRLESIGMLAAGIAHDFNNILAPILISTPQLRLRITDPSTSKLLHSLETSAERGAGLVRQILAFARGSSGEPHPIRIKQLMRDIIGLIEETFPKNIKLDLDLPPHTRPIVANPTQIHQVLLNLCVNARDAMPEGGTLRLRTSNVQVDDVAAERIPGAHPGAFVCVEVSDTGTGIPPDVLTRIWEPFFTTKPDDKGTGLGLSTVLGIVKSLGGFVTVETVLGQGTGFYVYLPATESPEEAEATRTSAPPFQTRGNGETILIIDDEADYRTLLQEALARQGYRVLAAADGNEAVALFMPRATEIQLVICDFNLPNQSGIMLARSLQRLNPAVRILILSGAPEAETSVKNVHPPFNGFLAKPVKIAQLFQHVHALLQR